MNFKKILAVFTTFLLFSIPNFSLADDELEDESIFPDTIIEASSDLTDSPTINARHSVILDRNSKTVLWGKSENETCRMASTTKIMTAIVVIENCKNLNDMVTVSKKAARNRWLSIRLVHK